MKTILPLPNGSRVKEVKKELLFLNSAFMSYISEISSIVVVNTELESKILAISIQLCDFNQKYDTFLHLNLVPMS